MTELRTHLKWEHGIFDKVLASDCRIKTKKARVRRPKMKKYECDHCGESFFSKNDLKKHLKWGHNFESDNEENEENEEDEDEEEEVLSFLDAGNNEQPAQSSQQFIQVTPVNSADTNGYIDIIRLL